MKIAIVEFNTVGGSQYTVVPSSGAPTGRIGGMKIIEMPDDEARELLKKQAEAITLQFDLQKIFKRVEQ